MIVTILICAALILLDQLFKWLAVQHLMPVGHMPLVSGLIELQYVENTGAAFNILQGKQVLLLVITGIALAVVAYLLLFRRPKDKLEYIALLMIFSGGAGNWIDRAANGYVVDYLNFLFMRFAVFNFADILVTVGFALLFIAVVRGELAAGKQRKETPAASGPDQSIEGHTEGPQPTNDEEHPGG